MTENQSTRRGGVEVRSIDYVPEDERHGKVWQQGPFWFLGNFQPFTVGIGLLGPSLGLSFSATVVASVLGIVFGTFFMAFHAAQGPQLGLPQMVQSRAQLGYRGVVVVLVGTLFAFVGFNVVDVVIINEGLNGIFGWNTTLVGIVITVVAAVLASYGHDYLHRAFQLLFWVSLPFWIILTIGIITGAAGGDAPVAAPEFTWVAFMVQFTVSTSYNITYAPYVSDYSRYLPRTTATSRIVTAVFLGAAGSALWLIPLGAWLGSYLGAGDALLGLYQAGNEVFGGLGGILTVLAVLALVATMGLNAYSAMLTVVTGLDSIRSVPRTRSVRVITIVVLAVVWAVVAIGFLSDANTALNNSLLIMLYLLAPWTAVNLVDYFFVRRGHYAITDLFDPDGLYHRWAWRGLLAYGVGFLVELPFVVLTFYTGPGAELIGGVDISFLLGLAVTGAVYLALTRSLDLAAEQPAIEASERQLAAA